MYKIGDIVEHFDGRKGVIVEKSLGEIDCAFNEVFVVFDNQDDHANVTKTSFLKKIGEYVKKIEEVEKCGIEYGEKRCKYLGFSCTVCGWGCLRFSDLRNEILSRDVKLKFSPTKLFPECQAEVIAAAKAVEVSNT